MFQLSLCKCQMADFIGKLVQLYKVLMVLWKPPMSVIGFPVNGSHPNLKTNLWNFRALSTALTHLIRCYRCSICYDIGVRSKCQQRCPTRICHLVWRLPIHKRNNSVHAFALICYLSCYGGSDELHSCAHLQPFRSIKGRFYDIPFVTSLIKIGSRNWALTCFDPWLPRLWHELIAWCLEKRLFLSALSLVSCAEKLCWIPLN